MKTPVMLLVLCAAIVARAQGLRKCGARLPFGRARRCQRRLSGSALVVMQAEG
jgi:hypothetical protein